MEEKDSSAVLEPPSDRGTAEDPAPAFRSGGRSGKDGTHPPQTQTATDRGLTDPAPRSHLVKFYEDDVALTREAGAYLMQGLQKGEALILVATPDHRDLLLSDLEAAGADPDMLMAEKRLRVLDAKEILDRLILNGDVDPDRFRTVVGGVVDETLNAAGASRVRAYGEMVDLLWDQGELFTALRLEAQWEDLIRMRPITLLCGYRMNLLGVGRESAAMESVCDMHSHAFLSEDRERLDRAVAEAFEEEMGPARAEALQPLIQANVRSNESPGCAEHTIFWIRRNFPQRLDPILAKARRHYGSGD